MGTFAKRYLLMPSKAWLDATVLRAGDFLTPATHEEAGRRIDVPTPDVSLAPAGDIRPTLAGVPETEIAGEISVNQGGVVDHGRYGWNKGNTLTDLQLRQSPMVVGRAAACIDSNGPKPAGDPAVHSWPRLLELASGDVMCIWTLAGRMPIFSEQGQNGYVQMSILDAATTIWSATTTIIKSDSGSGAVPQVADEVVCADVVQFPDTGEIILVLLTQDHSDTPTDRRLYTFHSVDDGTSWVERSRYFIPTAATQGAPLSRLILSTGAPDTTPNDTGPLQCLTLERLPSGRLVCCFVSEDNIIWSCTSDTRGDTWNVGTFIPSVSPIAAAGQAVASTIGRNGAMILFATIQHNSGTLAAEGGYGWVTFDGLTYSPEVDVLGVGSLTVFTDCAMVMGPDGHPRLYTTMTFGPVDVGVGQSLDQIMQRSVLTRDLDLNTDVDDWTTTLFAPGPGTGWSQMHYIENTGTFVSAGASNPKLLYGGFTCLDTIEHRGQILMVVDFVRQTAPVGEDPGLDEASLTFFRLNHFQPVQEQLSNVSPSVAIPTSIFFTGYVYNRTWDCYTLPSNVGFAVVGAGAATMTVGGVENGYLEIVGVGPPPTLSHFQDVTVPYPDNSNNGVVRVICQIVKGGNLGSDDAVIIWEANDAGTGTSTELKVRLEASGGLQRVRAINGHLAGGTPIGSALTFTPGEWIEILMASYVDGSGFRRAVAFARAWNRTGDPDWDEAYQTLVPSGTTLSTAAGGDNLQFGCVSIANGGSTTRWKGVHLHRPRDAALPDPPLVLRGTAYVDSEEGNNRVTDGSPDGAVDSGVYNFMRTTQMTGVPRQYIERGVSVAWRGESLTEGVFDYDTEHDYAAEYVRTIPVKQEWRSNNESLMELVFDSGAANPNFRPDAIAVFGRNFPEFRLVINSDPTFVAPAVLDYFIGGPFSGAIDRDSHLWAFSQASAWTNSLTTHRLSVTPPAGTDLPWRAHQFASQESGPKFYLCVLYGATRYVYRIRDNTPDTLVLVTTPTIADFGMPLPSEPPANDWWIFSDRFMVQLDAQYTTATASARYLRFMPQTCTHRDSDEQFHRIGTVVMGPLVELHAPMPAYGFGRDEASGFTVKTDVDGARRSRRNHAPRRSFLFEYGYLEPPEMPDAVLESPTQQQVRKTWTHWLDVVRRLGVDGIHAALAWEGDLTTSVSPTEESQTQVLSDPMSLACVRITNPGTVEHVGYVDDDVIQSDDVDECIPQPYAVIRGITMEEEL